MCVCVKGCLCFFYLYTHLELYHIFQGIRLQNEQLLPVPHARPPDGARGVLAHNRPHGAGPELHLDLEERGGAARKFLGEKRKGVFGVGCVRKLYEWGRRGGGGWGEWGGIGPDWSLTLTLRSAVGRRGTFYVGIQGRLGLEEGRFGSTGNENNNKRAAAHTESGVR